MRERGEGQPNWGRRARAGLSLLGPALLALVSAGCAWLSPAQPDPVPPPPSRPVRSPNPDQPPVIWVAGTLAAVTEEHLEVREAFGSTVRLLRLGHGATAFFRASGGRWREVPGNGVSEGQRACVEALLDRSTLFALRVFLGATCGPA